MIFNDRCAFIDKTCIDLYNANEYNTRMSMKVKWIRGQVNGFSIGKVKPKHNGWIATIGLRTWHIFKATNPTHNLRYVLTTDKHEHFSDHHSLIVAKQYAEKGGHLPNPNSYENRRARSRS